MFWWIYPVLGPTVPVDSQLATRFVMTSPDMPSWRCTKRLDVFEIICAIVFAQAIIPCLSYPIVRVQDWPNNLPDYQIIPCGNVSFPNRWVAFSHSQFHGSSVPGTVLEVITLITTVSRRPWAVGRDTTCGRSKHIEYICLRFRFAL